MVPIKIRNGLNILETLNIYADKKISEFVTGLWLYSKEACLIQCTRLLIDMFYLLYTHEVCIGVDCSKDSEFIKTRSLGDWASRSMGGGGR